MTLWHICVYDAPKHTHTHTPGMKPSIGGRQCICNARLGVRTTVSQHGEGNCCRGGLLLSRTTPAQNSSVRDSPSPTSAPALLRSKEPCVNGHFQFLPPCCDRSRAMLRARACGYAMDVFRRRDRIAENTTMDLAQIKRWHRVAYTSICSRLSCQRWRYGRRSGPEASAHPRNQLRRSCRNQEHGACSTFGPSAPMLERMFERPRLRQPLCQEKRLVGPTPKRTQGMC